ncbi:MAG: hypothetical protein NVS1B3_18340 [Candidatus Dormibacteraceae bacterium]
MTEELKHVREISHLAYGFIGSKALFAALDLDLFTILSNGSRSRSELATETGVKPNRLASLLAALTAVGLVVRDGDAFANSAAAEQYLVRGGRNFFGDYYRLQIDKQIYPTLEQLGDSLAGRPTKSIYGLIQDSREAELFSSAQHQGSTGPAILLAREIDLAGRKSLLDIAGGTGAFSIALCRRYPELRATIVDCPSVIPVARRYVEEAGLLGRIELLAGDALEVEWPGGQDVLLMSYLLSAVNETDITVLLSRSLSALTPGGLLIVHDFMLDEDRSGPREAAMWILASVVGGQDTIAFSAEELIARLERRGFRDARSEVLIPQITKVVTARAPRS